MHNQLATTASPPPALVSQAVALSNGSFAVSQLKSDRMGEIMRVIPTSELHAKMRRRGVAADPELRMADPDTQIQSLSGFSQAFLPMRETVTFIAQILAKVRQVYSAKQFGGEEFRLYFHANAEIMNGAPLRPIPACLASISGTGFWLTGPSGMGRTASLTQLVELLGKPFEVEGDHPAPRRMWVMPVLYLTYPTCGTPRGLFRDIRQKVLAEVGTHATNINALSDLEGPNAENVAVALCTLLNVGLVVLDGCGWANVNARTESIFRFLLKLRQFSGIPVLVSGTSAFMYSASYMGNLAPNLFNGQGLHLNALNPPASLNNDSASKAKGIWRQIVMWLWKQGLLPDHCEMPAKLPEWAYEVTLGRFRWLVQGFEALHVALLTKTDLQEQGRLTETLVKDIFNMQLQLHNVARNAIVRMQSPLSAKSKLAFLKNIDHLPTSAFDEPLLHEWLDDAILRKV
jgi:hypothetical protein